MVTIAVSDIVAADKIQNAAKSIGINVRIISPKSPDTNDDFFIVDFMDPYGFYVARTVKNAKPDAKVVGFYPHVRAYMKQEAEDIGCVAFTNAEFFAKLKNILRGKM